MKSVLLIGLGRFGRQVAEKLNELGHQVMAIDENEELVDNVLSIVTNAQIGDATNSEFLKSLGVNNFDLCIVAIGGNFQNSLETTALLKELGAKFVISRASTDIHAKFLLRNGADEVIYPEKQIASWAAIRYSADYILDFISIDENVSMFEVNIPEQWIGKTISQIDIRRKFGINIMAIKRDGKLNLTVHPDTLLNPGETILIIGELKDVQKCFHV